MPTKPMNPPRIPIAALAVALAAELGCRLPQTVRTELDTPVAANAAAVARTDQSHPTAAAGHQSAGDRSVNIGAVQLTGSTTATLAVVAPVAIAWALTLARSRRYRRIAQLLIEHNRQRGLDTTEKQQISQLSRQAGLAQALKRLVNQTSVRARQP